MQAVVNIATGPVSMLIADKQHDWADGEQLSRMSGHNTFALHN